jgi:hypothetical protein
MRLYVMVRLALTTPQNVIEFVYIKWCIFMIIHGAYAGQGGYVVRILDCGSLNDQSSRNGRLESCLAASGVMESVRPTPSPRLVVNIWLTSSGQKLVVEKPSSRMTVDVPKLTIERSLLTDKLQRTCD